MFQQNLKNTKGFTLVELLVVITIILIMTGISLPSVVGFMKTRRLKAAAQIIQTACIQARSAAIAQRERHFVIVYMNNTDFNDPVNTNPQDILKGTLRHVYVYDSNENGSGDSDQVGTPVELPEFINVDIPDSGNSTNNDTNFGFVFRPNGSMQLISTSGNFSDVSSEAPDEITGTPDMRFTQNNSTIQCVFDVIPNTGRVIFAVREP